MAPKDVGRLSLVLTSAIAATQARSNPLGFAKCESIVVVLVDGLGLENLLAFAGHAPNIMRAYRSRPESIRSEVPSTTVLSLASLATGMRAGEHGLTGYTVLDSQSGDRVNLLSGWEQGQASVSDWKSFQTLAERHPGQVRAIAPAIYANSGFTKLTLAGTEFIGVSNPEQRFQRASVEARKGGVTYLYVPELDQTGHRYGPQSAEWITVLEAIDRCVQTLASSGASVVLTADHGMVQVRESEQVYLESLNALQGVEFQSAGDTRCAFIHLADPDDSASVREGLAVEIASICYVTTWPELVEAGWQVSGISRAKTPDVVLLAKAGIALYDRRSAKPQSLKMLGHHGSITDTETRVPLVRWKV